MTGTQIGEMALLSLLTLLLAVNSGLSARIAGFHTIGGSQYMNMRHTMEELASRGHEVQIHYPLNVHSFFNARRRAEVKWSVSRSRNPYRNFHVTDLG